MWDQAIGLGLNGDDGTGRALLTRVRRGLFDAQNNVVFADVAYGYDGYGNRTRETVYTSYGTYSTLATGEARETLTTYDAYQTFPWVVRNPLGQTEERTWDAGSGKPLTIKDVNGNSTTLQYDGFKRLKHITGPAVGGYAKEVDYVYDPPATTANGRTTNRLAVQTRTDDGTGAAQWFSVKQFYDGLGRLVQQYADRVGGHLAVNRRYDNRGLLHIESIPHLLAPQSGTFTEDDWTQIDARPRTVHSYDELRRPRHTTLPNGQVQETAYYGAHTWSIDPKRHVKRQRRDGLGRMTQVVEHTGTAAADLSNLGSLPAYGVTEYQYDAADQLVRVVDAASVQTTIEYDRLGRKLRMTDPDMGLWTYEYDPLGNLVRQTDARGKTAEFRYDALKRQVAYWHRMEWTEAPLTAGVHRPNVHDLMELRSAVDTNYAARGWTTFGGWTDDAIVAGTGVRVRATHLNELKGRISQLWVAQGMGPLPDPVGDWPLDQTKPIRAQHMNELRGWLDEYELAATAHRARAHVQYDTYYWDATIPSGRGRRTWSCDGSGRSSWLYDAAGRVTEEARLVDGHRYATRWTYDAADRVRTMAYPDADGAEQLTYSYRADLLLESVVSSLGATLVAGAQYNDLDLPTSYQIGGAQGTQVYEYHQAAGPAPYGAPRTIRLEGPGGALLVDRGMGYDAAGNVERVEDRVHAETVTYGYDDLDRLVSASAPLDEAFAYDVVGRMTSKNGLAVSHDPNHEHAVSQYNGVSYGYDANGNMTARGADGFQYDPRNRLTRVSEAGTACRYAYDGDGRRTKRLDANGTVHYAGAHYERNVGAGAGGAPVATKYYHATFGKLRRLVAFRRGAELRFVGADHLGSTVRVAGADLGALDAVRYTSYGEARDPGTNLGTDRTFTGQTEDAISGLYWYRSRYYDPVVGRFTQPDPHRPGLPSPYGALRSQPAAPAWTPSSRLNASTEDLRQTAHRRRPHPFAALEGRPGPALRASKRLPEGEGTPS